MDIRVIIVGCPKPFVEPFQIIQQNAIKSWQHIKHPRVSNVRVVILGDEEGVNETCQNLECEHISDIKRNEYGTPLVNRIFERIKSLAKEEELQNPGSNVACVYINCDIIIFNEFLENIVTFIDHYNERILKEPWLLVGTRWDTDNVKELDFVDPEWDVKLRNYALKVGSNHGCGGIDYFIFGPETYNYIYPFALGKFVWDRWLVGNVFRRDSITIDISQTNFIVHQNGPWFQASRGTGNEITTDRKGLFDTDEVELNQLFDFYDKDVYSGTRYETNRKPDGTIEFIKKITIPRIHE